MSGRDDDFVDSFLTEIGEAGVPSLVEALANGEEAPSESLKDRILAGLSLTGRFDRFIESVSDLLEIDHTGAKGLLDAIHLDESWHVGLLPDVHLYDVEGGPSVANAITGFVRMPQGTPFPEHEHMGKETALIIQGSAVDGHGEIWNVGDIVVMDGGTDHSFAARPGPDLLFLVVVHTGIKIGGTEFGPDSPDL